VEQPIHKPTPPNGYAIPAGRRTLRQDLLTLDPTALELGMGLVTMVWAVWLILPFDSFVSSPSFALFRLLAGSPFWGAGPAEVIWAVVAFIIGYGQWRAARARNHGARRALCFAAVLFWLIVAGAMVVGNSTDPMIGIAATIAVKSGWAHLRNGKTGYA
jgi:hypothetical protein